MGSLLLIKRSSSSSSLKILALTAVSRFITENPRQIPSNALFSPHIHTFATGSGRHEPSPGVGLRRDFHSGLVLRAGFAVTDYSDADEKMDSSGPSDEGLEISKLGISQEITSALARRGIQRLFPIQKAVLEPAMQGRDMIGRARTGTGKTLASGIPIVDKIIKFNEKHGLGRSPLALILAPTRELAKQSMDKVNRQVETAPCYPNSTMERKSTASPSVIVIGAGFAGIAAARELHDAAFQVILLESRDRIGGRVHTNYSFGFPVDLGASWLHGVCEENPLAKVIGELGLPLYRTGGDKSVLSDYDSERDVLFDMDGNQVPQDLVSKVGETFESILKETDLIRQEVSEDMSISRAISIVFERRPDLRLEGLGHKVLQWYLCGMESWFAGDCDDLSLKCWDQEELLPGGHGMMIQGYLPVINTIAKGLDIRTGHRVTKVVRLDNGVKVSVEDGTTFLADAAIVTVPLGVLKSNCITFEPRLPEWKEEAIKDLGVGIENKIVLHFEKVFWPNVEFLGVVAETSYECSIFVNLHKATGHAVLVCLCAGQLARDIEKMSDETAANFAFTRLKRILPNASAPIQHLVSRWGTDKHSMGSYSNDRVGASHELYEKLRIPVDNLFFAGEATSAEYSGCVHGAYSTGLMAAEDCRMRVLERY